MFLHGILLPQALPGARAIQFYAYGIHPPRRHGDTENVHGTQAVSRTPSPCPRVWGKAGTDRHVGEANV